MQWGFASSPVIHEDRVIVQCDVQKGSFLAALSLADGKELWRTPREESSTWCTPTVLDAAPDRKAQVLVNGYKHIGAYDLAAGTEIWKLVGGGDVPVPAPIVAHELVFLARGMQLALRTSPETEELLRARGITCHIEETSCAVILFNRLWLEGKRVAGVFHSTC